MKISIFSKKEGESIIPVIETMPQCWQNIFLDNAKQLEQMGLYNPNLLYRSFSPNRLKYLFKTGSDRNAKSYLWEVRDRDFKPEDIIYAAPERLLEESANFHTKGRIWHVVVYDPKDLSHIPNNIYGYTYVKKNGIKPIAILKINLSNLESTEQKNLEKLCEEVTQFKKKYKQ